MPERPPRALHDPALCLAPGLFRSLVRGSRAEPWAIDYDHGPAAYHFECPARLGCDDLRVLQGIVALANEAKFVIRSDSSVGALQLRGHLHVTGRARDEAILLVQTSLASLASSAGYAATRGGAMGRHLESSLTRLASLRVEREEGGAINAWNLIAWDKAGAGRDKLRIALNPHLGRCAKAEGHFTQIEMTEARRLVGDLARLLHQRLCGYINASQTKLVRRETLIEYPGWSNDADDATLRQRRAGIKAALEELKDIGWEITKDDRGIYRISRPALGQSTSDVETQGTGVSMSPRLRHRSDEIGSAA